MVATLGGIAAGIIGKKVGEGVAGGIGHGIAAIAETARPIIAHYFPDPEQAARAQLAFEELAQRLDLAQIEVNKIDAAHPSLWVAGWRPAVGWICAGILALYYGPFALVSVSMWAYLSLASGVIQQRPDIGIADVIALLGSMLGIAYLRTEEKKAGVATVKFGGRVSPTQGLGDSLKGAR